MAQVLGIVDVVWRGRRLATEHGASFKPGGVRNVPVVTGRRVDRAEQFAPGEVVATVTLARGTRYTDLYTRGEGELQVLCDTGQTYVWGDAFLNDLIQITGGEGGKIELKWTVGEAEELLNG